MSKVTCTGKHLLLQVEHNNITYECMVSYDCKELFTCEPEPDSWTEIENIIRDAAWNLEIEMLDELG
jgi:hypothetical protein